MRFSVAVCGAHGEPGARHMPDPGDARPRGCPGVSQPQAGTVDTEDRWAAPRVTTAFEGGTNRLPPCAFSPQ